jgi:hypothetical protein
MIKTKVKERFLRTPKFIKFLLALVLFIFIIRIVSLLG